MQEIREVVTSYRRSLEKWGIRPARDPTEAFSDLSAHVLREYVELCNEREYDDPTFYEWISDRRRLAAVHSTKWTEILTSGVWAHLVIESLDQRGRILDAGCNAGYWTTWQASRYSSEVVGIDRIGSIVELGRSRMEAAGLQGRLEVCSYVDAEALGKFSVVVSLQGLTYDFVQDDLTQLRALCSVCEPRGYLLIVDTLPDECSGFDLCLREQGFGLAGVGNVGGLSMGTWQSYACLVYQQGSPWTLDAEEAAAISASMWDTELKPYVNEATDWVRRNWAYCWAEGGTVLKWIE
jgi:SAM-dependent methyltransferase